MGKLSFLFKSKSKPDLTVTIEQNSPTDEKPELSPIAEVETPSANLSPTPEPIPNIHTGEHNKGHAEAGTQASSCCNVSVSAEADARNSHCCTIM